MLTHFVSFVILVMTAYPSIALQRQRRNMNHDEYIYCIHFFLRSLSMFGSCMNYNVPMSYEGGTNGLLAAEPVPCGPAVEDPPFSPSFVISICANLVRVTDASSST
jgi:hypothetical protein